MLGNVHSLPREHLQGTERRTSYGERVSESLLPVPRGMRKRVPVMPSGVLSSAKMHRGTFVGLHSRVSITLMYIYMRFTKMLSDKNKN